MWDVGCMHACMMLRMSISKGGTQVKVLEVVMISDFHLPTQAGQASVGSARRILYHRTTVS